MLLMRYRQGYHLSKTKSKHAVDSRCFRRQFKIFVPNYILLFEDHVANQSSALDIMPILTKTKVFSKKRSTADLWPPLVLLA